MSSKPVVFKADDIDISFCHAFRVRFVAELSTPLTIARVR